MPSSAAERCRKYREKLKKENPKKFEEMKKKNLIRTKAQRRKISDMNEKEKEDMRKKWRVAKQKKVENDNRPATIEPEKIRRRYRSQVGRENKKLKEKVQILFKKIETLRKQIIRLKKNNLIITGELRKLKLQQDSRVNVNQAQETNDLLCSKDLTPKTKSNIFIEKELPDISEEAKEKVKLKLLQQHVLEDSLKETYKLSNKFQDRKVLKKLTESETCKKYNMKMSLAKCLGIQNGVKRYYAIKQKRLKTACDLKKFFERNDVSRMTAGKKEYVTKNRIQKQKRFLLDTLLKLYRKYKHDGGTVSFTTFKRYRPFYIVPPKVSNRNTCACIKHSNLTFKAEALKKLSLIKTTDLTDLVSQIVCNIKSKTCMYSECKQCRHNQFYFYRTPDQNLNKDVSWYEYIYKSYEFEKNGEKKNTKRMVKVQQTDLLINLMKLLQRDLNSFKPHHYNIYHQYIQYKESIEKVHDNEVVLHCDFSENYVCKMAEEVQAMHFGPSKTQVTLHTGLLYFKNENPLCFCTISPSLKHGPEAIWAHLKPIIDLIKEKKPMVIRIHIWSDGPSSQYRQKYNFFLFCEKMQNEGFQQATWSFFEASHGKGAADGIGGVVKRTLDAKVAYGEDVIDAKSVFEILLKSEISVKLFYISEKDIEIIKIDNPEKNLPIPSTMKIHQVIVTENKYTVKYRPLSCFCSRSSCECFDIKSHVLIKESSKNQHRLQREVVKKTKTNLDSSSDDTDTEIEYAESDQSDWNEFENANISDQEELQDTNKIQKTTLNEKKLKFKNKDNLTTEARTKNVILQNKEIENILHEEINTAVQKAKKKKIEVKILADIKNTPENQKYFNLKTCGLLTKIGLDFDVSSSGNNIQEKENIYSNPLPSCSSYQEVGVEKYDFDENDVVLVRYYMRKAWRYYVGFVKSIHIENCKTLFTISFLKTVKSPKLKFIVPKKDDLDIISTDSLVKKIRLVKSSKDFYLVDDFDEVYFV